jgi:hypothetical protein
MRRRFCLIFLLTFVATSVGMAQNPASNKAFFAKSVDELVLAPINGGTSSEVTIFDIPAALKTSSVGALSATVSLEAAIWTYNLTTAIVNGGKNSSSSRAAIKVWVEVDGYVLEPGLVVYADRLQATGLAVNLACGTNDPTVSCTVTGDVALDLFQATKGAQAFTFFGGPLAPVVHSVRVKAQGFIECPNNSGVVINCPTGTLAGYDNASTLAAIGKATLVLEEHNNWGR